MKSIFSNTYETNDFSKDERLITHYYANTYEDSKNEMISLAKLYGYTVENIDDNYHEMYLTSARSELIVTFYSVSYYVTSVDFKITTMYLIPFGKGAKIIDKMYNDLNKRLSLKKVGGGADA